MPGLKAAGHTAGQQFPWDRGVQALGPGSGCGEERGASETAECITSKSSVLAKKCKHGMPAPA